MADKMDTLDYFYAVLKEGTTVTSFLNLHKEIMKFIRVENLIEDYVLGRGRVKKLRDEVSPVVHFVRNNAAPVDWIRFALDDTFPDCRLRDQDGRERGVEVTIAQARERLNVMTESYRAETGRGVLGLSDDAPTRDFKEAMGQDRQMFSTDQVVDTINCAIGICARRKRNHQGDTLLIEVVPDMLIFSNNRWDEFRTLFAGNQKLKALEFSEVYLTGCGDGGDICLRIKPV